MVVGLQWLRARHTPTRLEATGAVGHAVNLAVFLAVYVEPGSEPATDYLVGCRLYRLEHRFAGQPEERWVREALVRAIGSS